MRLRVNGQEREVDAGTTVATLVPDGRPGVAVALDGEVVPRSAWERTELAEGQSVEILEAKAGG